MTVIQKRTACNRDCPDACGIVATIQDGRVTRLQGDPNHPVTQGFLCHRTSRFLQRQYSANRLMSPLIRDGDQFREIDWSEALDRIAEKMSRFHDESGAASILHYRCGGSMGIMKHVSDYFFQRFGPVTVKSGDICSGAGEAAQMTDFGRCDSSDLWDIANSRTIVLWGKNVYVSSVHLLPLLKEAKKRGAKLILIDPVRHRTADLCDLFVQPRPAGDAALAMGVARWLFDNNRIDPTVTDYCDHVEQYRSLVLSKTIEQWALAANVAVDAVTNLAAAYADGPSSILVGWSMQRRKHGSTAIRALDALGSVSGNIGVAGGGVSFYFARRAAFDFSFSDPHSAPRTIPEPLLGPGILSASDPPIRMVWVTAANPVAMLPQSNTVAEALQSRELTVVVDSFMTDSARCADIILPTTTMLEEDDLLGAYGHHWLIESTPVIDAPSGIKSDYEIVQALAQRVGLGKEFSEDARTWKNRLLKRVAERGIDLSDFQQGAVKSPFAEQVLFQDRKFDTESGKVNLLTKLPDELTSPKPANRLTLSALSTDRAQSSQWSPSDQIGPASATIHPSAADGFKDGDIAILESDLGSIQVRLSLDSNQRPDVVLMEKGGWLSAGRCANALIKAELTDAGQCAVYYDTLVRIGKT